MQSRYYSPEWGRFINADAIAGSVGELLGHNIFVYCKNDAVNMCDPNGFRNMMNIDAYGSGIYTSKIPDSNPKVVKSAVSVVESAVTSAIDSSISTVCNDIASTEIVSTIEYTVGGYFLRASTIATPISEFTVGGAVAGGIGTVAKYTGLVGLMAVAIPTFWSDAHSKHGAIGKCAIDIAEVAFTGIICAALFPAGTAFAVSVVGSALVAGIVAGAGEIAKNEIWKKE